MHFKFDLSKEELMCWVIFELPSQPITYYVATYLNINSGPMGAACVAPDFTVVYLANCAI